MLQLNARWEKSTLLWLSFNSSRSWLSNRKEAYCYLVCSEVSDRLHQPASSHIYKQYTQDLKHTPVWRCVQRQHTAGTGPASASSLSRSGALCSLAAATHSRYLIKQQAHNINELRTFYCESALHKNTGISNSANELSNGGKSSESWLGIFKAEEEEENKDK